MTVAEVEADELDEELGGEDWEAPAERVEVDPLAVLAQIPDGAEIVVSAFAGIGGLDVGFERAGFTTGVQIEWDAAASRVLAARFPHAAHFGDVRTVDGDAVRHALGGRRCRVLVGGFPCQDLSVAGSRAGMAGERSGLYGELLRLAAELDPDWLVVENVPGLLSADADPSANEGAGYGAGSGFALFLGDLTGFYGAVPAGGWRSSGVCHGPLGTCAWRVLDAKHFGVAQRRRRVFVVFCPRDRVAPAAVLLEPEGVRRDPASRVPSWALPAGAAVDPALHGRRAPARSRGAEPVRSPNGVEQVSALTMWLGKGGPDAAHALAGWMTPADEVEPEPVTAAETGFAKWREGDLSGPLEARGAKSAKTVVAYGVAMRGRAEGNVPEVTEEEVSALRAASGGSTRDLVVPPEPIPLLEVNARTGRSTDDPRAGMGVGQPGDPMFTLQASQQHGVYTEATPIQDGREIAKGQNGMGVGEPDDPSYTLDTTGAQAVAVRHTYEVDKERGRPNDEGIKVTQVDVSPTITADGDPAERTDRGLRIVEPAAYRKSRRAATSSDDETWVEADHANTLNCFDGGDTRATEVIVEPEERAFTITPETGGGADLTARETDCSPTLDCANLERKGDRGVRLASTAAVRRLTPTECERLQGLPDGWTAPEGVATSDSARYRQLGNAVTANVAEWVAMKIADYRDGLLTVVGL